MKHTLTRPARQPLLRPLLIGLGGVAALTASSYIAVPMYPVPVTMQTLVVLMLGLRRLRPAPTTRALL